MADEKRTAHGDKSRRRPAPQIDLTATEVAAEPAAQAAEAAPESANAEPSTPESPPLPKSDPPPPARSNVVSHVLAGAVGAVIAALIVGGGLLWLANPPANPASPDLTGRLAALEAQIRDLAQKPVPRIDMSPLEALARRLGKVEEIAGKPQPVPPPDTTLRDRIATLESGIAAAARSAQALQSNVQSQASAAIDALNKRLDALEQSAKLMREKVAQNTGADAGARQALAAMMLRDAVARGGPFGAELAAAKDAGADARAIATLDPFAASGLPSEPALAHELTALLPSMIAASNADPARSGGFLERLEANASKLVRIRPVGEPAGGDSAAVLARIEVRLARGDIAGADKEIGALPDKARAIAEPWRKKVAARAAAIAASRKLAAESAAALTK